MQKAAGSGEPGVGSRDAEKTTVWHQECFYQNCGNSRLYVDNNAIIINRLLRVHTAQR